MLHPGDRIGDWEIVLPLGQGGMGSVYRCRHALTERIEAAVKVLKPTDRPGARERFIREAEALHALRHPAIVRIAGFGQDAPTELMWLAMELVHGENFERLLQRGQFPRERIAATFGPVAEGLAYAHTRGIVHRDIKPGNLMLQADGAPVLLDFGIAVQEGQDRLTREGVVPGTVAYAAPEAVVAGGATDPALCDVYALGQVLCECLTGRFTYPRTAEMDGHRRAVAILRKKLKVQPLDPGEGYAPRIRALVRSATDPDPARRGPPLVEWATILGAGPIMEEETASLTALNVASLGAGARPPEQPALPLDVSLPASDSSVGADLHLLDTAINRRRSGTAVWIGVTAAVIVALGVALLVITAVGGAAAWWSLSSPAVVARPEVPLGEVLVVEAAPEPVVADVSAPEVVAAPSPGPDVAPAPARPAAVGQGRLVLASEPAASVSIDGERVRRTPLSRDLPAGRHTIELTTGDGRTKRFTVYIAASEKVRRMWSFDDAEWRSFEGGMPRSGLPARPANVGDARSLLRALPATTGCLSAAGRTDPVTVVFTVAPDGSVVAEGVREAELRGSELEACLKAASRQLTFGRSTAGAAVTVQVGG